MVAKCRTAVTSIDGTLPRSMTRHKRGGTSPVYMCVFVCAWVECVGTCVCVYT